MVFSLDCIFFLCMCTFLYNVISISCPLFSSFFFQALRGFCNLRYLSSYYYYYYNHPICAAVKECAQEKSGLALKITKLTDPFVPREASMS